MWLKLLLLTLYLIFLFILSRILETATWFQDTEKFLTSFVALDPLALSVKKLKQILDNRGISYSGVVEKQELIDLVEASGQATGQELAEDSSPGKVASENVQFTCGSHFYEEVEDTKDSAWLVQVVVGDGPILSKHVWADVVSKVSKFGIRTGQFKCSLDQSVCRRHGWLSSRIILTLPRRTKRKGDSVLDNSLLSSSSLSSLTVFKEVQKHLTHRVEKITSTEELRIWTEFSKGGPKTAVRIIFFSGLPSCPMFLSALAVKFTGRVEFGMVDTRQNKVDYQKIFGGVRPPAYFVVTPEQSFTYGSKKGESLNLRNFEIFLKTLVPEMNDVLYLSFYIINGLAAFELFFVSLTIWKHFVLYWLCAVKYNAVLIVVWALIFAIDKSPINTGFTDVLGKCLRIVSGSYAGTVIRNDYEFFYSYIYILCSFVAFAATAGFVMEKYKLVDSFQDAEFLSYSWWRGPLASAPPKTFNCSYISPQPDVPSNSVEKQEEIRALIVKQLADQYPWLLPILSMEFLKDLAFWKHQKGCRMDESAAVAEDENSEDKFNLESDQGLLNLIDLVSPIDEKKYVSKHVPDGMYQLQLCSICQNSYKFNDILCGLLCGHNFHLKCIMGWLLREHHWCPLCRKSAFKAEDNVQHPHFL